MARKGKPKPDPAVIKARQLKWLHARRLRETMSPEQSEEEREALELDLWLSIYVRELEANDWQVRD